jgi:putative ABC transport system substrate-binding protein
MKRRQFITLVGGALVSLLFAAQARAQKPAKAYRVGLLFGGVAGTPVIEPFRQGLRELGWVEGQNVIVDYRFAAYRYDRLPDLAAELVRLGVDVIVSPATPATVAAKRATGTIPIVMVGVGDPVAAGLIESLAHPGGNVTGLTFSGAGMEIYAKQLELLAEVVPQARRVAVLSNPANPNHEVWMAEVRRAGESLGVRLRFLEARGPAEFDGVFATMADEHAAALLIVSDSVFLIHRERLAEHAARNRLPSLGYRELVEAGGLMSYGPSLTDLARRSATYVDKILKGARPADLAVEQPTKVELVINLNTAKALGLTVPASLLARADRVIE